MPTITANTGSNNWNTNGAWVGGVQPSAADDVVIPASAVVTIPTGITALGRSCTVQASGTLAFASTTAVLTLGDATAGAGSVALSVSATATITLTGIGTINLISTSATVQTITSNGKTLPNLTVNGAGSSYQLADGLTIGSGTTLTLTNGTFDTNGKTCSWGLIALGVGTKTLTLGASTITITAAAGWNANTNSAGLTLNAGTSTITSTVSNSTFAGGGFTYNNYTWNGGGNITISGANTFANLSLTSGAGQTTSSAIIQANQTITTLLTLVGTDNGTTSCGRIFVCPAVYNGTTTQRTITAASVSITNADFHHIAAAGASTPWTGTNVGDAMNNTNITFTSPRTLYWVGNGGNSNVFAHYATSTGGTPGSRPPLPQDDVVFDTNSFSSGSQTITLGIRCAGHSLDFTNVTNSPTLAMAGNNQSITGGLTLKAGMSFTANAGTSLTLLGTGTFTSAGVSLPNIQVNSVGTVTLGDAPSLPSGGTLTFVQGIWDINHKNISTGTLTASTSVSRTINNGDGTITLSGTGTVLNMNDVGLTLSGWAATMLVTDTSATTKTVNMPNSKSSFNVNSLNLSGGAGSITVEWAGGTSNHLGTLKDLTITGPATVLVPAGQVTTITGTLTLTGSAGNLVALSSATPGTVIVFNITGSTAVQYASFQDVSANPAVSISARDSCTDSGNNHNVIFAFPNMLALAGVGGPYTPGGAADVWLLEDSGGWLLEDGSGYWLLEA